MPAQRGNKTWRPKDTTASQPKTAQESVPKPSHSSNGYIQGTKRANSSKQERSIPRERDDRTRQSPGRVQRERRRPRSSEDAPRDGQPPTRHKSLDFVSKTSPNPPKKIKRSKTNNTSPNNRDYPPPKSPQKLRTNGDRRERNRKGKEDERVRSFQDAETHAHRPPSGRRDHSSDRPGSGGTSRNHRRDDPRVRRYERGHDSRRHDFIDNNPKQRDGDRTRREKPNERAARSLERKTRRDRGSERDTERDRHLDRGYHHYSYDVDARRQDSGRYRNHNDDGYRNRNNRGYGNRRDGVDGRRQQRQYVEQPVEVVLHSPDNQAETFEFNGRFAPPTRDRKHSDRFEYTPKRGHEKRRGGGTSQTRQSSAPVQARSPPSSSLQDKQTGQPVAESRRNRGGFKSPPHVASSETRDEPARDGGSGRNGFGLDGDAGVNGHAALGPTSMTDETQHVDMDSAEKSNAVFSLNDLDRQLKALDVVLDGLKKMRQSDLAAQMQNYRDQLANSLNSKVIPQLIDTFQEVSSMARSDDGGEYTTTDSRVGPTKPPMKKFRRTLPAVSAPQALSGVNTTGSRRKPPKPSQNSDYRRFELFGPQAWGYDSYNLTSQETSDVSISPDVQYSQRTLDGKRAETRGAPRQTPRSTSTGINTEITKLNASKTNPANPVSSNGFDGFRPVFQAGYGGLMPSHGSYNDLRGVAHAQHAYLPANAFSSSATSLATTNQSTPSSSVPTFAGPPGLTPIVFNTDSRMAAIPRAMFPPQYMHNAGSLNIPMMSMSGDAYSSQPNMLIRTPSASSMPNQAQFNVQSQLSTPHSRRGDGSYDPNGTAMLVFQVQVEKGETKDIYFYPGDNVRDVARKFCINHNILNHSTVVENELAKILRENHPSYFQQ